MMIISVHVPKTADSSFGRSLEHRFGGSLLRGYTEDRPEGPPVYTWPRRWRSRAWVRSHTNELAASYDAIHGHFTASKYFPLLRASVAGRGGDLCIFLRELTDRMISHYRDCLSSTVRSRYAKYIAKLLTLHQYASLPKQSRAYAIYTDSLPMEQFSFVGITEELRNLRRSSTKIRRLVFPARSVSGNKARSTQRAVVRRSGAGFAHALGRH